MIPFSGLQAILTNLQRVTVERHRRLSVHQESGLKYSIDAQYPALTGSTYATGAQHRWRTDQECQSRQQLMTRDRGAILNLKQLRSEIGNAALCSHLSIRPMVAQINLHRPVMHYVPFTSKKPANAEAITELFGSSDDMLNSVNLEYMMPPALLYPRLLNLCLALLNAFSLSVKKFGDRTHWTLHLSTWSVVGRRIPPFAFVERGELIHVERTLYQHPTFFTRER